MSELITISVENHITDVRLNRPEKLNALNQEMFAAIGETIDRLAGESRFRAVVLTGEGKGLSGLASTISVSRGIGKNKII